LIEIIAIDQKKRQKQEDSIGSFGSYFDPNNQSTKNLEKENGDFIWFQLFIETLLRMSDAALYPSRKEFVEFIREQYDDDVAKLRIIDELESSYQTNQAIWWYTRDTFLYGILNKALRQQDYILLFTFRFFLRDLYNTLVEQKHFNESIIHLYRGQVLDVAELNKLINNQGKFISMNSLLSTSRDRSIAQCFAEASIDPKNDRHRAVLFEIEADTSRTDSKPFADITHCSYYKDNEGEILFMAGSIFSIVDIQQGSEGNAIWTIKLVLCGEQDNRLNDVFINLKANLDDETDMVSVGKILDDMGKYETAKRAYDLSGEHMRNATNGRFGNPMVPYTEGEHCPEIIKTFQKGIVRLTENNGDRKDLAFNYQVVGATLTKLKQYDDALENYSKALDILLDLYGQDHLKVAAIHEAIAQIYEKQEKYQFSIASWKECLRIRQQLLPKEQPIIAETFRNIGDVYNDIDDFDQAITMYEEALRIQLISLPLNHPSTAKTYRNLAWVYEQMNQFQLALKNYTIALDMLKQSYSPDHPGLVQIQEDIDNVKKALIECSNNHFE
jgi:tetratricopeptide (TPR) repeat protein